MFGPLDEAKIEARAEPRHTSLARVIFVFFLIWRREEREDKLKQRPPPHHEMVEAQQKWPKVQRTRGGVGGRMRDRRGCKEGCILIKSQVEPKRATHVGRGLGGGG